jgi:hypothetical protein
MFHQSLGFEFGLISCSDRGIFFYWNKIDVVRCSLSGAITCISHSTIMCSCWDGTKWANGYVHALGCHEINYSELRSCSRGWIQTSCCSTVLKISFLAWIMAGWPVSRVRIRVRIKIALRILIRIRPRIRIQVLEFVQIPKFTNLFFSKKLVLEDFGYGTLLDSH